MTVSHSQPPTPEEQAKGLGWSAGTDGDGAVSHGEVGQQRGERCWARSPYGPETLLEASLLPGPITLEKT